MNRIFIILLLGFCLTEALPAAAEEIRRPASEAYIDTQTGYSFGKSVGSYTKVRVSRNRNPVFGTTIHFQRGEDSVADIYIYALREDAGTEMKISDEDFEKECASVSRIILNLAKNKDLGIGSVTLLPQELEQGQGVCAHQYRIVIGDVGIISRLIMFRSPNGTRILKCRISYPENDLNGGKCAGEMELAVLRLVNGETELGK